MHLFFTIEQQSILRLHIVICCFQKDILATVLSLKRCAENKLSILIYSDIRNLGLLGKCLGWHFLFMFSTYTCGFALGSLVSFHLRKNMAVGLSFLRYASGVNVCVCSPAILFLTHSQGSWLQELVKH